MDGKKESLAVLSGLRPYTADILATHIRKVNDIYGTFILGAKRADAPVTDVDLDYVLLDVSRDANAFDKLLKAQIAHAKVDIQSAVGTGNRDRLNGAVVANAQIFGHLLEARNQTVLAEGGRVEAANKQLQANVSSLLGLVGNAGAEIVGQRGGAPAQMAYDATIQAVLDKISAQAVKPFEEQPADITMEPKNNTEAIEALFGQLLVSSLITHNKADPNDLKGEPFATDDDPPRLRPLDSLTPDEYEKLLQYSRNKFPTIRALQGDALKEIGNGMTRATWHYRTEDGRSNVRQSGQG
ncbi:DUF6571 family protein [Actinomadura vinacea]|uniref:DUF6571 family protein n=1 Tax=Actinomadura vinacea TaxID=115336 RepID=UPI0031D52D33